jgi:hypothetical protein
MFDLPVILAIIFILIGIGMIFYILFFSKKTVDAWKQTIIDRVKYLQAERLPIQTQIMELDKLVEYGFQNLFNQKDSLGNLLKLYAQSLDRNRINEIWFAHKIRNKLVHEVEIEVELEDLQKARNILYYECKRLVTES